MPILPQFAGDDRLFGHWCPTVVRSKRARRHKDNKNNGTATLPVNVPGAGTLSLTGKGVKTQRPGGATASKAVTAARSVKLLVKPKGKTKHKLTKTGKAKVKVSVTFTPTGGVSNTQSKRVKLIKKR